MLLTLFPTTSCHLHCSLPHNATYTHRSHRAIYILTVSYCHLHHTLLLSFYHTLTFTFLLAHIANYILTTYIFPMTNSSFIHPLIHSYLYHHISLTFYTYMYYHTPIIRLKLHSPYRKLPLTFPILITSLIITHCHSRCPYHILSLTFSPLQASTSLTVTYLLNSTHCNLDPHCDTFYKTDSNLAITHCHLHCHYYILLLTLSLFATDPLPIKYHCYLLLSLPFNPPPPSRFNPVTYLLTITRCSLSSFYHTLSLNLSLPNNFIYTPPIIHCQYFISTVT